jgi:hypothetical protein
VARLITVPARSDDVVLPVGSAVTSGYKVFGSASKRGRLSECHTICTRELLRSRVPHGQTTVKAPSALTIKGVCAKKANSAAHSASNLGRIPKYPDGDFLGTQR